MMPQEMQDALSAGKISEGHTRPLLMLIDRPQEQQTLFREIMLKKVTVRDAEAIARRIAFDRVRRKEYLYAPEIMEMEKELTEKLGTRVMIEPKENGGKLSIDFFGEDDLRVLFASLAGRLQNKNIEVAALAAVAIPAEATADESIPAATEAAVEVIELPPLSPEELAIFADDRPAADRERDENTFDADNFSI